MTPAQEKKLNELHTAIVGNRNIGHKGIIERIDTVERYQEKDKKHKNFIAGAAFIISALGSALFSWLLKDH